MFCISADNSAGGVCSNQQHKSNDLDNISTIPKSNQTLQQAPRKPSISNEPNKPQPRACLAGTQAMQHLVRNTPQFDPFPDHLLEDSGNYSTDAIIFNESGNNSFAVDGSPKRQRYFHSLYESNTKDIYSMARRQLNRFDLPSADTQMLDRHVLNVTPSPPTLQRRVSFPVDLGHRYAPTPFEMCGQRQDLEVLEENMANASRYVDILTDGGSGHNSRESSCVRSTEIQAGLVCGEKFQVPSSPTKAARDTPIPSPIENKSFQRQNSSPAASNQMAALSYLQNQLNLGNSGKNGNCLVL